MQKVSWIILWVVTTVVYAITLAANYFLTAGSGALGLNISDIGEVSDKFYLDITPASWAFSIWAVIYLWQAAWLIYAITLVCRRGESGPLYYTPPFFLQGIFVAFTLNLLCNITWNVTFSLEYVEYSLVFIALIAFFLYICIAISFYGLRVHGQDLINEGRKSDVAMTIFFVQNGLGIYATWVTVATLLNVAMVLHYYAGVELTVATSAALGILSFELILWFVVDNFILEKSCRYFFITYCVVIYALGASIDKNWDSSARNSIFTAVLVGVAGLCLVVKVILVIVRSRKQPLYDWSGTSKKLQPL